MILPYGHFITQRAQDLNAGEKVLVAELVELMKEGRARILGVIRQVLLSGIKSTHQYEKLRTTLRSFPDEFLDTSDYEFAAKNSNDCRANGIAVSVVDAMICAVGMTRDWPSSQPIQTSKTTPLPCVSNSTPRVHREQKIQRPEGHLAKPPAGPNSGLNNLYCSTT